jgi:hypothetical protein
VCSLDDSNGVCDVLHSSPHVYPVIGVKITGSDNEQQVEHTLLEMVQHLARNKVHEYVRGV